MTSALHNEVLIDMCSSDNEIGLTLLAAAPDEVLVAAAKLGNSEAFAELWERHSKKAVNMAYRVTRNSADAEDVAQDAWMNAYARLNTFDGRATFATWLTRIVINSALVTLRKKRTRPGTSMEVSDGETFKQCEIADPANSIEELFTRYERAELLRQAISRLAPSLRMIVEIHQANDSSVQETADLAGISLSATKSRLLRARTKLRIALVEKGRANPCCAGACLDVFPASARR